MRPGTPGMTRPPRRGVPGTTTQEEERGYWHFKWTVRTGQDGSHDYVPDGTSYPDVPWGPMGGRVSTMVRPEGWGEIKNDRLSGASE